VLGVVAVLAVATSALVAATVSPCPARQWLRAHGLEVAVPTHGWRLEPPSEGIRYDDDAVVSAPAVLDAGFCPSSASSSRAFVGLLSPAAGAPATVVARTARTWAEAIAGTSGASTEDQVPTAQRPRVDIDVPVPPGPCAPTTAHLTVVGRATNAGVVALVLVRDVGEPGDLSATAAEEIVDSLRATGS
jgi:hypothetical protein